MGVVMFTWRAIVFLFYSMLRAVSKHIVPGEDFKQWPLKQGEAIGSNEEAYMPVNQLGWPVRNENLLLLLQKLLQWRKRRPAVGAGLLVSSL